MKSSMRPEILLKATIDGKCNRDRKYRAVRDAMIDNVNLVVPNVGKEGQIDRWTKHTKDASNW